MTITEREAGPLLALGARRARGPRGARRCRARRLRGRDDRAAPRAARSLPRHRACGPLPRRSRAPVRRGAGRGARRGGRFGLRHRARGRRGGARGAPAGTDRGVTGAAFDPTAPVSRLGRRSAGPRPRAPRTLDRAGRRVESIDRIVSGASGARRGRPPRGGDARRRVASGAAPARRDAQGGRRRIRRRHARGGCSGDRGRAVRPPRGVRQRPDPALAVVPHDGSPLPPPRRLLVTALAAGGAAAWALLERREQALRRGHPRVRGRAFDRDGRTGARCAIGAEVVVVDDGSEDGTGDAARACGVPVLTNPVNLGKGAR